MKFFNSMKVINQYLNRVTLLLAAILFVGCASAPQMPITFHESSLGGDARVGVVMSKLPELNVYLPGADCLLCIAAAETMNASLSKHVESLRPTEFSVVKSQLVDLLREKGVQVIPINKPFDATDFPKFDSKEPNMSPRDFSTFRQEFGITHLLVVDVQALGMWRSYSSYIPTSDPMAYLKATCYLVDLANNQYVWFKPIEFKRGSEGDWDEPPDFPGLTTAYFRVLEEGREAVVAEF